MGRIEERFAQLRRRNKKAFIAFITAGDPNLQITRELILSFPSVGVDILELGVPFSDPLADGATIQSASERALSQSVSLLKILELTKQIDRKRRPPLVLFTYYNPVHKLGIERFVELSAKASIEGLIIPDLPLEEAEEVRKFLHRREMDLILLLAPTTKKERMKIICQHSQGFIYYISRLGTTGARDTLPSDLKEKIKEIRKITSKPIAVGFGVSTSAQVKQIEDMGADGVVVGSAIVKVIEENLGRRDLLKRVLSFIEELRGENFVKG